MPTYRSACRHYEPQRLPVAHPAVHGGAMGTATAAATCLAATTRWVCCSVAGLQLLVGLQGTELLQAILCVGDIGVLHVLETGSQNTWFKHATAAAAAAAAASRQAYFVGQIVLWCQGLARVCSKEACTAVKQSCKTILSPNFTVQHVVSSLVLLHLHARACC
jgi:hypothetical protein